MSDGKHYLILPDGSLVAKDSVVAIRSLDATPPNTVLSMLGHPPRLCLDYCYGSTSNTLVLLCADDAERDALLKRLSGELVEAKNE